MRVQYLLAAIIVGAGILAGGVIFFTGTKNTASSGSAVGTVTSPVIRPVDSSDHIIGNLNAPVKVIQYGDTACPFCGQFMSTMKLVMNAYQKSGKVAWVYRSLPDEEMHPESAREAEAAECVAELGGNERFWQYAERLMERTSSNAGMEDPGAPSSGGSADLAGAAASIGIDRAQFQSCLDSGKFRTVIKRNVEEGLKAGATATPFIVIMAGGDALTLQGAQPYDSMRGIIDTILDQLSVRQTSTTTAP